MPARLIANAKEIRDDGSLIEVVVWKLPQPIPPCSHCYKYRLYDGSPGGTRVRYDNERGKGDHRHIGEVEESYHVTDVAQLLDGFRRDVERWR